MKVNGVKLLPNVRLQSIFRGRTGASWGLRSDTRQRCDLVDPAEKVVSWLKGNYYRVLRRPNCDAGLPIIHHCGAAEVGENHSKSHVSGYIPDTRFDLSTGIPKP